MKNRQDPSDSFLIEQYKSGQSAALPILVKRWHKTFCEKAFWVTKNKEAAKDIAQDSWITIIKKIHTLEKKGSFKSWAFRIVYTKAIDYLKRSNKANKNLTSGPFQEVEIDSTEDRREQIRKTLLKAIQQLPGKKQDIIRLFYTEEYSIQEISSFLNIPIGTVKSRLFKAREHLKSHLKNINYEK